MAALDEGPVAREIRTRVTSALGGDVEHLSLINDSANHAGHVGLKESGYDAASGETHFKLQVVSDAFVGLSRLKRHQLIYGSLGDLMTCSVHALNIKAQTKAEASPPATAAAVAAAASTSASSSSSFKALLSRRILLIRHGNTGKAAADADRTLTDQGAAQCDAFRSHYAPLLQMLAYCCCSPATRTRQTAELLLVQQQQPQPPQQPPPPPPPVVAVQPIDALYFGRPGFRSPSMLAAEQKLGYAPAEAYLKECPGQYETGAREMATALAAAAAGSFNGGGDVLVVSHAVYISYLALALIDALADQKQERLQEQEAVVVDEWRAAARAVVLPVDVGEVCCFEISDAGCRYLPNPLAADFASASSSDAYILGGGGGE